ncbi:fungal-specific transcription factor domain-containing protein [Aspergillus pseudoustus]|uniref:Fungal-specific transcription factor domain-containing protein n=1 Tax=Aspergillus pseudoustus TaxID=1810923 RepID=A0ABR4K826_9EURO
MANDDGQTPQEEWTPLFVGFSGDQDPFILRHCQFSDDYFNRQDWRCMRMYPNMDSIPMHFAVRSPPTMLNTHSITDNTLFIQLVPDSHLDTRDKGLPICPKLPYTPEVRETLLRTFFETVHTSLPLLDIPHFTKTAASNPSLVTIACRLATPFRPELTAAAANTSWPEWRNYLHTSFATQGRSPRLEMIETGLLFAHRPTVTHRAPNLPGLWPQIGSLVGIAHEMGLNVDPSGWRIAEWERKRRIRLWWALLITDKWNALGTGRPSYTHDENWNVPMLSLDDVPSEGWYSSGSAGGVPRSAAHMFVAMAALTTILSDILVKMYSIRSMRAGYAVVNQEGPFDLLDHFEQRLEVFEREHRLALEAPGDQMLNPSGTLVLALYTVRMVLYRAVLRHPPSGQEEAESGPKRMSSLRFTAQALSTKLLMFVFGLTVTQLRAFWWVPLSRTNFAIAGSFMVNMLLSSTEQEEIAFWTAQIDRYRILLEMHAASFDVVKLAVKRLELITSVIENRVGNSDKEGTGPSVDDRQAIPAFFADETMIPELGTLGSDIFSQGLDGFLDFSLVEEGGDVEW